MKPIHFWIAANLFLAGLVHAYIYRQIESRNYPCPAPKMQHPLAVAFETVMWPGTLVFIHNRDLIDQYCAEKGGR